MPRAALRVPFRAWHLVTIILSEDTPVVRTRATGETEAARFARGDCGIYPAGPGERIAWPEGIEAVHVHLRPGYVRQVARTIVGAAATPSRVFRANDPLVREIGFELRRAVGRDGAARRRTCERLIDELVAHLARTSFDVTDGNLPAERPFRFEPIVLQVMSRSSPTLRLDDLPRTAGLSKSHFCRRFTAELGVSPYQFVLRCRLERAKYLLSCPDKPLAAVAYECGFSDQSAMTRMFRRMLGTTPGRFRSWQAKLLRHESV